MFSDEYYEMLKTRLAAFGLESPLEKSRTSIGFTNSFELVSPKIKNDTEINIFRKLEDCRGTPCNPNRKFNNGEEVILCECLNASLVNTFAYDPTLTQQTQVVRYNPRKFLTRH